MFIEQSHDEVYCYLKGGIGNSRGKRLAISMVEEAWLSEKKEVVDDLEESEMMIKGVCTFLGKPNGQAIRKIYIQNGPTPHPMITDPPTTDSAAVPAPRKKLDSEFSEEGKQTLRCA
ncbi:hypothetical protein Tco_1110674 [Tanacetum coccineum]|uniref:Uncharacterized protein n=1 Tax=Tanacetum coccineum TaxID=301880 RepID=A0ABQ5IKP2_9ASTR